MGFFSKKTYVCEKCGKEFEKRVNLNGNICDECRNADAVAKKELEKAVQGYTNYHINVFNKKYTEQEKRSIIEHRERLLNKFKNNNGISIEELETKGSNYNNLTDRQKEAFLKGIINSTMVVTNGAAYTGKFFCPTEYEEVIVDAEDVFAVGFTTDHNISVANGEAILCAIFTNDPYIPVFPILMIGKKGLFEMKSNKGREQIVKIFQEYCPNLSYPVGELKQLKKQIKQDRSVRGNVDMKFMLEQIGNAEISFGIFNTKKMNTKLYEETVTMLDRIGYIPVTIVNDVLEMDKKANKKFWEGEFAKFLKNELLFSMLLE